LTLPPAIETLGGLCCIGWPAFARPAALTRSQGPDEGKIGHLKQELRVVRRKDQGLRVLQLGEQNEADQKGFVGR